MKICYFDCPAGASGDMILAALVDAGLPARRLREDLARLGLTGYALRVRKVRRSGVEARQVDVRLKGEQHELRVLPTIRRLIRQADLPDQVKSRSLAIFERLARAEAEVHGIPMERVHFHEIGAVDTIVDVVGAAVALEVLGIDRVEVSPLPLGRGTVLTDHGELPLPAPATLEMLKGVPVYPVSLEAETVTPTGAAILTTLAERFGSFTPLRVERTGYGAGSREDPGSPNLIRAWIGTADEALPAERAAVLEANVDDMVPEQFEHLMSLLFEAGAQDVSLTPTVMKKSRPGTIITVIGPTGRQAEMARVLLAESTSIGLRHWEVGRIVLPREVVKLRTRFGTLAVKVARIGKRAVNVGPEYEDCRRAARKHGVPLKTVYAEAMRAAAKKGLTAE